MKRILLIIFLLGLLPLSVFGEQVPPDLILINGKIFTADSGKPFAEALAIRGDRVIAVGPSAEITALAGGKTRRIDLQGRVVVPGFNDAHFHFMPDPKGFNLQFKTMEPSWQETMDAVKSAIQQTPVGTWIFGRVGRGVALNPEVTRFALDRIAPDHPVLLRAFYAHGYILNSKAMPLLQIAEEEPDPVGGYYERISGSQRINGRFGEYAQWKPDRILINQVTDEEAIGQLHQMADEAIGYGITSMQIMPSTTVDRFARLLVKADLPIRIRAIAFPMTSPKGRDLSELRLLANLRFPNSKVTVSGIKWILDGTPIEGGAALRRPYNDRPNWSGKLNFPENEVTTMVKESMDLEEPLLLHAVGDRTCEAVLKTLESYAGKVDWKTKRVRIEHGDGLIDDLISRGQKLGVIVVQNPSHFGIMEPEVFHKRWGMKYFPFRSLIEAGIPVAVGSDGPMNPFLNIMFATIHPYNPKEAITREQSVRAYTYGSAFAEFSENEKGTITKGKLADLAVLSHDIFAIAVPELPKTKSILTIVGGKIVYDAKVLQ